jgi:hypothetical protein
MFHARYLVDPGAPGEKKEYLRHCSSYAGRSKQACITALMGKSAAKESKGRPVRSPFLHIPIFASSLPAFRPPMGWLNAHDLTAAQADVLQHPVVEPKQFPALTPKFDITFNAVHHSRE